MKNDIQNQIETKLGFIFTDYNNQAKQSLNEDTYECDNKPNPFDVLTIDELIFLREHNYFL